MHGSNMLTNEITFSESNFGMCDLFVDNIYITRLPITLLHRIYQL